MLQILYHQFHKRLWKPRQWNLRAHDLDYGHAYEYEELFCRDRADIERIRHWLSPFPVHVLDLGGGAGRLSFALLADGHHLTLLDASADMLRCARARAKALPPESLERLQILQADMRAPIHGKFDRIISLNHALEHLPPDDRLPVLRQLLFTLNSEGEILIDVHNPEYWRGSPQWASGEWEFQKPFPREAPPHPPVLFWMRTHERGNEITWEHAVLERALRYRLLRTRLYFETRTEWEALFQQAKLTPLSCWGDWNANPPSHRAPKLIFRLRPERHSAGC